MPNTIQFSGINRTVSDFSGTGACEELINLRPLDTGLVPAKGHTVIRSVSGYARVFEQEIGTGTNRIAFKITTADGSRYLQFYLLGSPDSPIWSMEVPEGFSEDSVHIANAGNILLISISDAATSTFTNVSFIWRNNTYETMEANVPDISAEFTYTNPQIKTHKGEGFKTSDEWAKINSIIDVGMNAIQVSNKDLCFGPCIVAIAFKTNDGKTFWTGRWYVVDPRPIVKEEFTDDNDYLHITNESSLREVFEDALAPSGSAFIVERALGLNGEVSPSYTRLGGATVTMSISAVSGWNKDTSIISGIEIYASRPRLYADTNYLKGDIGAEDGPPATSTKYIMVAYTEVPTDEMHLDRQLLYLQKSYRMEELAEGAKFDLTFGGDTQTTDKTLEVDPGMMERTGKILSYNARFHFYASNRRTYLGMPQFAVMEEAQSAFSYKVFCRYKSADRSILVYLGPLSGEAGDMRPVLDNEYQVTVIPSLDISEVILLRHITQGDQYAVYTFTMQPAEAYNYSICLGSPTIEIEDDRPEELVTAESAGVVSFIDEAEPSALNVTEQYNPFVFKVQHSYLIPGEILDVQPQLVAVADISIGNAPLDIFTTRGVYALLQGNGTVLYGETRPLSDLISSSNSAVTDGGTFILASGALWAVAGLSVVLVSDALQLGPHMFIRSNTNGYGALCNNSESDKVYDISALESQVSFESYSEGAAICYNRFRDELLISNPAYRYSYVLSLKHRQWFKVDGTFYQEQPGTDTAVTTTDRIPAGTAFLLGDLDNAGIEEGATVKITVSVAGTTRTMTYTVTDDDIAQGKINESVAEAWFEGGYADYVQAEVYGDYGLRMYFPEDVIGTDHYTYSLDASPYTWLPETTNYIARDLLSFSTEDPTGSILVHLQSRPITFGSQYSKIRRVVQQVRTDLTAERRTLTVALYGSDDLQDWRLLAYGNRTGGRLSQVRTTPAARSWRYYTITIGGRVPADTDLGPLLIDFDMITRRIG